MADLTLDHQAMYAAAAASLDKIQDRSIFGGITSLPEIEKAEQTIGLKFPPLVRRFIQKYGSVGTEGDFQIFGLGHSRTMSPSILWAFRWLRLNHPDATKNLLPIGAVTPARFVCLDPEEDELTDSVPLIYWDLGVPTTEQKRERAAASYSEFLGRIAHEIQLLDHQIVTFNNRVRDVKRGSEGESLPNRKTPRNHNWRVYRFSSRDIVLGIHAQKHLIGENCLEVDVFLPIDLWPFEPGSSLMGITISVLTDAYRCGGTMEIRFTENVDGNQVPRKLVALAETLGAPIKEQSLKARRLDPDDARRLFVAMTEFDPAVQQILVKTGIKSERVCFAVHRGIWPKPQAEWLVLNAPHFDRIFGGGAPPQQRLFFQEDLAYARTAILAEHLDQALTRREQPIGEDEAIELEDDLRDLDVGTDLANMARIYIIRPLAGETEPGAALRWLVGGLNLPNFHPFHQPLKVLLRARSTFDLRNKLLADIDRAALIRKRENITVCVAVPYDFYTPSLDDLRSAWIDKANRAGVGLLVGAEPFESLTEEAMRRFKACKIIRE